MSIRSEQADTIRLCVDRTCPKCGWAETWYETTNPPAPGGTYGCNKCDYRATVAEHTVTIEPGPRIRFTCHGDDTALCHWYPDCDCEAWELEDHPHPSTSHEQCWMQDWFDNDGIGPSSDTLDECEYTVGMSGPISTSFEEDHIEWAFEDEQEAARLAAANRAEAQS